LLHENYEGRAQVRGREGISEMEALEKGLKEKAKEFTRKAQKFTRKHKVDQ